MGLGRGFPVLNGPCVDGSGLARRIFTLQRWSVQPCVRPVRAALMTAGHNALRGSGPGQKHAFDNALAQVGCPDRRIDRHCITCCSPSQPLRHAGVSASREQAAQIAIALLADAAELVLSPTRVLLRHEPHPGREIPSRSESLGISDACDQCGCQRRADAGDRIQPLDGRRRGPRYPLGSHLVG
jgi:hypothetical protein